MITENLSTLKIHKFNSKEQYERLKEEIGEYDFCLTPDTGAEIPSFDLMSISTEGVPRDGTEFGAEYDTTGILEAIANGAKIINIKIPVKDVGEVACAMSVIEALDTVQLSGLFSYVGGSPWEATPFSATIIVGDGYITAFITKCLSESDSVIPVIINIEASTYTLKSGTSVLSCTASHTPEEVYQMMSDDKLFICTVQQMGGGPSGDLIVKECAVNLQLVTGSGLLKAVFCDEYTIYGDLHENRWYAELNIGGDGSVEGAVRYDQHQELTDAEKEQARANINVLGCDEHYQYCDGRVLVGVGDMVFGTGQESTLSIETYPRIGEHPAQLRFLGATDDEPVQVFGVEDGTEKNHAVNLGQLNAAVGNISTALDAIIIIQKKLMGQIITFTFDRDDTVCIAEPGMDWDTWTGCRDYNTVDAYLDSDDIVHYGNGDIIGLDGVPQTADNVIHDGTVYELL